MNLLAYAGDDVSLNEVSMRVFTIQCSGRIVYLYIHHISMLYLDAPMSPGAPRRCIAALTCRRRLAGQAKKLLGRGRDPSSQGFAFSTESNEYL